MSNIFEEACWICGQPTKNRCGACEEAGIDIFFCSREHHNLVWPLHKLVCGPGNAHPFRQPAFSDYELAELKAHLDDAFVFQAQGPPFSIQRTSVRDWLTRTTPLMGKHVKFVIGEVAASLTNLAKRDFIAEHVATAVRAAECMRTTYAPGARRAPPPLDALLFACQITLPYLPFKAFENPPSWWSPLLHRTLFWSYLALRMRPGEEPELKPFVTYAAQQLWDEAMQGLGKMDKVAAERFVEVLELDIPKQ